MIFPLFFPTKTARHRLMRIHPTEYAPPIFILQAEFYPQPSAFEPVSAVHTLASRSKILIAYGQLIMFCCRGKTSACFFSSIIFFGRRIKLIQLVISA